MQVTYKVVNTKCFINLSNVSVFYLANKKNKNKSNNKAASIGNESNDFFVALKYVL